MTFRLSLAAKSLFYLILWLQFLKFFYWRIIALQNFVVFCHTSARISHRYTHVPSLPNLSPISPWNPPFSLLQSPCLSSLSHTANSHWLSILHKLPSYSLYTSHPLPPPLPPCPLVYSLCLFFHCCPENKFISTIFLYYIYNIYLSLSDLFHSV